MRIFIIIIFSFLVFNSNAQTSTAQWKLRYNGATNRMEYDSAGTFIVLSNGGNSSISSSSISSAQLDSALNRMRGKQNAIYFDCILRPVWTGSNSVWEILGRADSHDTLATGGLTVSTVGGQLRVSYPSVDYVCGFSTSWDDQLQKNLYAIGASTALTFSQFSIWKNFLQTDLWLGSDLLTGSYVNSSGNIYRIKCDTTTGIFTVDLSFNTSDTIYNASVEPANYYGTFPQAHIVNIRRKTSSSIEFYLTDALTGNARKGLLTTNDNFYISINGRKAVNADVENFGGNAAILFRMAAIRN